MKHHLAALVACFAMTACPKEDATPATPAPSEAATAPAIAPAVAPAVAPAAATAPAAPAANDECGKLPPLIDGCTAGACANKAWPITCGAQSCSFSVDVSVIDGSKVGCGDNGSLRVTFGG
jgi:hypothetical protein